MTYEEVRDKIQDLADRRIISDYERFDLTNAVIEFGAAERGRIFEWWQASIDSIYGEPKEPYPATSPMPHPRHNPEAYEEFTKQEGKLL